MSKYLVLGDSGHAEKVAGKCAPDKSLYEWKFNKEVDTKMKKRCADHGIDYYQTNPSPAGKDEMGLSKRAELANAHWKKLGKPQALLMSYHANAYYEEDKNGKTKVEFNSARGTETFIASNASTNSKNAAKYIQDEIVKTMKSLDKNAKDRGVKTENFTVIYKAQMPSILLEYAFYTNKSDIKILKNNVDEIQKVPYEIYSLITKYNCLEKYSAEMLSELSLTVKRLFDINNKYSNFKVNAANFRKWNFKEIEKYSNNDRISKMYFQRKWIKLYVYLWIEKIKNHIHRE